MDVGNSAALEKMPLKRHFGTNILYHKLTTAGVTAALMTTSIHYSNISCGALCMNVDIAQEIELPTI